MPYEVTTAPTFNSWTVSELRTDSVRGFGSSDDSYIEMLLKAAEEHVEASIGGKLATQTVQEWFSGFSECITLELSPLQSISSIQYYDSDNSLQTLSTDLYQQGKSKRFPIISLKENQTWPDTYSREDAVMVNYVVGFTAQDQIPATLKASVAFLVNHWYDNRSPVETGIGLTSVEVPKTFDFCLGLWRKGQWGS